MSAIGCLCSLLFKLTFLTIIVLFGLAFIPTIDIDLPKNREPASFISIQPNDLLSAAELLHVNEVHGPESIVEIDGDLYFGVRGGKIVKSTRGRKSIEVLVSNVSSSPSCIRTETEWDQKKCGRVLGVRLDSKKNFYVLDAESGVKKVDIKTGKVESVYTTGPKQAGRDIIFVDDFVIQEGAGKKGGHVFYITDSSAKYPLDLCVLSMITREATGRVIKVDSDTKEVSVVSDGIAFPNGIELMDDGKHLLVNEISNRNLLKINIQTGKKEVLIRGLPGLPDNIRRTARTDLETYWIAFYQTKAKEDFGDQALDTPYFTKALLRMVHNLGIGILKLGELSNCRYLEELGYQFRSGFILYSLNKELSEGLIMEVNSKGKILRALQDPHGKISHLSEVKDVMEGSERVLYLGSYVNPFLGRLVLPGETVTGRSSSSSSEKKSTTTTTPRPTTTTRSSKKEVKKEEKQQQKKEKKQEL